MVGKTVRLIPLPCPPGWMAWLSASASLDVHPNTLRFRLRRAAEIAEISLNDAEQRYAAMLKLRPARPVR
ncbi:hypothetical protein GCM10010433_68330 [Streptomyces pulveraceus]|uniref:Helix-turn-helix domain-containing protein n=1 Tax=Streptomyces pulveraceus TaxID=68258 RepID=A0ABW1GMX7_9ACTN